MKPTPIVRHADWSIAASKRWVAEARPLAGGRYELGAPRLVGDPAGLLDTSDGPVIVGVDFPIGLPAFYAARVGIERFTTWLPGMDDAQWRRFRTPAQTPEEIGLERPFYPARPGGALQRHLLDGLGAAGMADLRRRCESRPPLARQACSLFWTLGGNQVGRAALDGWETLVRPALEGSVAGIWPFDGDLVDVLERSGAVLAETYPAEFSAHLGLPRFAKSRLEGRQSCRAALFAAAHRLEVDLTSAARAAMDHGFAGDDAFDAFVGALGMVNVLRGGRRADPPADFAAARRVEGWVLGAEEPGEPGP